MTKGINCPHCVGCTKRIINCKCGYEGDKFTGDTVIHISKYCNNKYTQCSTYQGLRGRLQS